MSAQEPSYDENALRVESRLGDLQIVRGTQNVVVASASLFHGPKVANLVVQSDKALAEARMFEREYGPGQAVLALGIAALGAAVVTGNLSDTNAAVPISLSAASFALIAYGGTKLERAHRALSRAIWWYNRDLKR
jgi:F420-dependent methylenetetrahydromethanopterin dehydrogenase